jgi:hypothetical protein
MPGTIQWRIVEHLLENPWAQHIEVRDGLNLRTGNRELLMHIPNLRNASFRQSGTQIHDQDEAAVPKVGSHSPTPLLRRAGFLYIRF